MLAAIMVFQFTVVPVANAGRTLAEEDLLAEKLKMISGDLRIVQNRPEAIILQIPPSQITPTIKAFAGPSPGHPLPLGNEKAGSELATPILPSPPSWRRCGGCFDAATLDCRNNLYGS